MGYQLLYRLRDADGRLLYIGITDNLGARLSQHEAGQSWWPEVASAEFERYETRSDVAEAERVAVRSENPVYNVIRFQGPTKLRTFRVTDDLWRAAQAAAEEQGESVTSVILAGLQEYIDGEGKG